MRVFEALELAVARLDALAEELEAVARQEEFIGPSSAALFARWARESAEAIVASGVPRRP